MTTVTLRQLPPLHQAAVHLLFADARRHGPGVAKKAAAWFDPAERERLRRLRFHADRELHLVAHVLLREVLSRYTGMPAAGLVFTPGERGKPVLEGAPELAFSLAHAGGVALLGVALDADLGVDVESVDSTVNTMAIARRHFHPEERRWLQAAEPMGRAARFTELWTLKESVAKATGRGLSLPLATFSCVPDADGTLKPALPGDDPTRWQVRVVELVGRPSLRAAYASRTRTPRGTATVTAHDVDLEDGAMRPCPLRAIATTGV